MVRASVCSCAALLARASPATQRVPFACLVHSIPFRKFLPFVIDLGGAVSMRSFGALKLIAKLAADAARPRLPWEAFDWSTHMQRRIAVAMVRCTAWIATRKPARVAVPGSRAGLARLDCASRSPAPADSPATG